VLDRFEQSDRSFLDEILEREAVVAVPCRDRADEAEVASDESCAVAAVAAASGAEQSALAYGVARGVARRTSSSG
jgi:hypothetical protein